MASLLVISFHRLPSQLAGVLATLLASLLVCLVASLLVCLSQLAGLSCRQLAGTCLAWCFFFFSRFLVAVFFEGQAGFLGQLLGLF